jgi:hypothetical protein
LPQLLVHLLEILLLLAVVVVLTTTQRHKLGVRVVVQVNLFQEQPQGVRVHQVKVMLVVAVQHPEVVAAEQEL